MQRILTLSTLLLSLAAWAPDALAQKKGKGLKEGAKADARDFAQIQNVKEISGKLAFADDQAVTLRVDIQHLEPNPAFKPAALPKGVTAMYDLQNRYNEILRGQIALAKAKTPAARQRLLMELQRDMRALDLAIAKAAKASSTPAKMPKDGPFRVVSESKDFDLDLRDKVVVRWLNPPFEYDEKGNPKTYAKEELEKLRGKDLKLPGYSGKTADLMAGQTVKLFLTPPSKDLKKTKIDADEGVGNLPRPTVHMILIVEEGGFGLGLTPPKKGKK